MVSFNIAFDDLGGKFRAKLKALKTQRRTYKELYETFSNTAILEAKFDMDVFERLHHPTFIAIERERGKIYSIYEVVGINPVHYQMSGLTSDVPLQIREEFLARVGESWGSDETWIDITAVQTDYSLVVERGEVKFERRRLIPLVGSDAHLLSTETVKELLCVEDGLEVGTMLGFEIPLTVDPDDLIRYHVGVFGFSVDYNEPIIYRESGKIKIGKIGELVDQFFEETEEGIKPVGGIEVVSFDPETYEVKWGPVQYVLRHRFRGKLLKLSLETGRSVTVTPGHSIFVLRGGRIRCIRACDVRRGDFLVGIRRIPSESWKDVKVDLIDVLKETPGIYIFNVPRAAFDGLKRPVWVPRCKWWYWRRNGILPISLASVLTNEERESVLVGCKGSGAKLKPILEVDEELAKLLGYYVANGHVTKVKRGYRLEFTFGTNKMDVAKEILHIMDKKFGVKASISKRGRNSIRVSVWNRVLVEIFEKWAGRNAINKVVPEVILNSPRRIRRAFIEAWIAGAHGVSISEELINGIMYLLLMEGIVATVNPQKVVSQPSRGIRQWRPRLQLRPEDLKIGIRPLERKVEEPSYPAVTMPEPLKSLYPKTLKLDPRDNEKGLKVLEERNHRMSSYVGPEVKGVEGARHDGLYRMLANSYLAKEGGRLMPTQKLLLLLNETGVLKRLAFSDLAFFRVLNVEKVEPSSEFVYDVSVPGAENFLAGFGGVFCHNTGVGKSNITANLLRKLMLRDPTLKVVILDVSGEYTIHLLDFLDRAYFYTTERFEDMNGLVASQVIPETLEKRVNIDLAPIFEGMINEGRFGFIEFSEVGGTITLQNLYEILMAPISEQKAGHTWAKMVLQKLRTRFSRISPSTDIFSLNEEDRSYLLRTLEDLLTKVRYSGLKQELEAVITYLSSGPAEVEKEVSVKTATPEELAYQFLTGDMSLLILYLPEPELARKVVSAFLDRLLYLKKRRGIRTKTLTVIDEAQEFIPRDARGAAVDSNRSVEALLRQGRKYRSFAWISTQRVAHLNTNALQQLHSYFVSTLPRMYDRMVIADAFSLDYGLVEKVAELSTGEWLFVSYKATKQKNVPAFIRSENNEDIIVRFLQHANRRT